MTAWILGRLFRLIGIPSSGLMAAIAAGAGALVWVWWRNNQLSRARRDAQDGRAYRDTRRRMDNATGFDGGGVDADREWLRTRGGQRSRRL